MLKQVTRDHLRSALTNSAAFREIQEILNFVDGPGDRYYVDSGSGDDSNNGTDWDSPLATLAAAVAKCTASQGDTIYLMPGHNENIGNEQITINIAGIKIIGLGYGASRPRFDFDHASASIDITANDVLIRNITLLPSVTDVLVGIDVNAAALNTTLEDIEALPGEDGAGVDDFALTIDIKAGCTRTTCRRIKIRQHASAVGYLAGIRLTGASDDVLIEDCDIDLLGAGLVAPINGITTLSTKIRVRRCTLVCDAEPGIELLTGTTGVLSDNDIFTDLATIDAAIVADGCALFRNEYVEVGNESNARIGTASVDD